MVADERREATARVAAVRMVLRADAVRQLRRRSDVVSLDARYPGILSRFI